MLVKHLELTAYIGKIKNSFFSFQSSTWINNKIHILFFSRTFAVFAVEILLFLGFGSSELGSIMLEFLLFF